jgi:hypothetical protein
MKVEADQADCLGGGRPRSSEVAAPKRRILGPSKDQDIVPGERELIKGAPSARRA